VRDKRWILHMRILSCLYIIALLGYCMVEFHVALVLVRP